MLNELKKFYRKSNENKTQVWVLFSFLVLPVVAMFIFIFMMVIDLSSK